MVQVPKRHIGDSATDPPPNDIYQNIDEPTINSSIINNIVCTTFNNYNLIDNKIDTDTDNGYDTVTTATTANNANGFSDYETTAETFLDYSQANSDYSTLSKSDDFPNKDVTQARLNTYSALVNEEKLGYGYDSESLSESYNNDYVFTEDEDSDSIQEEVNFMDDVKVEVDYNEDFVIDNNIVYTVRGDGLGKSYVGNASHYPPELDANKTVGAIDDNDCCTNYKCDSYLALPWEGVAGAKIESIHENEYEDQHFDQFISDTSIKIKNNKCILYSATNIEFKHDDYHDIMEPDSVIVKNKCKRWMVNVPIRFEDGTVTKIPLLADVGANAGCVKTTWALKHFPNYIRKNNRSSKIYTPGGFVIPKYVLWLAFPTISGKILKARMYLIDRLPVDIIADINMLEHFGYQFKDETPEIFRHPEKEDINLDLADMQDQLSIFRSTPMVNLFNKHRFQKLAFLRYPTNAHCVNITQKPNSYDKLLLGEETLYDFKNGSHATANGPPKLVNGKWIQEGLSESQNYNNVTSSVVDENYEFYDSFQDENVDEHYNDDGVDDVIINLIKNEKFDELCALENVDVELDLLPIKNDYNQVMTLIKHANDDDLDESISVKIDSTKISSVSSNDDIMNENKYNINGQIIENLPIYHKMNNRGQSLGNCPIYHRCLFIMSRESFRADDAEIARATAKIEEQNKLLKWNNLDYLKEYEFKYGPKYKGLYTKMCELIDEYRDVFATHTFDRRTMNVPPARLGIKPEHRDKIMFARQYPISAKKREDMIVYTILNRDNGFWHKISHSLNCVPYTMVPKYKLGVIIRHRPAFDGRPVNQYCELMPSNMPTLKDFIELHSIRGLTTMADVKNCFDCIPLHEDDQRFAVASTPLGLFKMTCLTYGWMNAAPEAQKIMNNLALYVTNTLAYIDDICIKHPIEGGTQQVVDQNRRLLDYCRIKNIQLNPSKYWPGIDSSISFSYKYTMIGRLVAEAYQKKLLALVTPNSLKEVSTVGGVVGYTHTHIYNCNKLLYWLKQLKEETFYDESGKKKTRLKWTTQAKFAWEQLKFLISQLPKTILHHPTRDGQFCLQTDACNYGIGAVLWQKQFVKKENKQKWVIVDMWSKIMPQQLRHCHSMVHEAYAIVAACEHWQFYLLKRKFIVSTDNQPVANIFARKWRELSFITQKQLVRLRSKVSMFTFDAYHVKGLDNPIADSLSRFTLKLVKENPEFGTVNAIASDDTNTPALTPEQRKIINEECERLEKIFKTEKAKQHQHTLLLQSQLQPCTNDSKFKPRTQTEKYESFKNANNKAWNELMQEYRNNANYLEKQRVKDLIYNTDNNILVSDENSFNSPPLTHLPITVANICTNISKLKKSTKHQITQTLKNHQHCSKYEHLLLSQQFPPTINAVDEEYDPKDDEDEISDDDIPASQRKSIIRTRSQRRREQAAQTSEDLDNRFLNAEFEDARRRLKTREDFSIDIFGHRRDLDIFNISTFVKYQKDDNLLMVVRKLVQQKPVERNEKDVQFLFRWDPYLYQKLELNLININSDTDLITVTDFNSLTQENVQKQVVPFNMRGKLMDYAHHNLQLHHFHWKNTYDEIYPKYWWGTMKKDVRDYCSTCITCQFTKGSVRHRTPLQVRQLPKPRQHIFADFLGSIFGRYYILVLVDYATGYTMLIPTNGTDAPTIIESIIKYWIPIFGWFSIFESDWGSGFNSKIMKALTKIAGIKLELAEPRNHRSIGKVERTIGFLQTILNSYNLQLGESLTQEDRFEESWQIIESILPFIQLSINQHRPRFTTFSPNMLMFGTNLDDISDIDRVRVELQNLKKNQKDSLSNNDYEYLSELISHISNINELFKQDWKNYTWVSRESYNNKYKITPQKVKRNRYNFKVGKEVLYYIGDKAVARRKWRRKWTGPWIIDKVLNDSTVIIGDPELGNQKRVSIDRLKLFNKHSDIKYAELFDNDDNYINYQNKLLQTLKGYNVEFREKDFNLDFTNSTNDKSIN